MTNKKANEELKKKNEEILKILKRLTHHFKEEEWADDEVHFGHVGDAQKTAHDLKEICDQVFGEGEYA